MYTRHSRNRRAVVSAVSAACFGLAGCNVDGLWATRPMQESMPVPERHAQMAEAPVDIRVSDAREVDLVEQLVAHRQAYQQTLAKLREYYEQHGYAHKESWADHELKGLRSVQMFRYLMDAEIPGNELAPRASIPEADALYAKGVALMKEGGHGVPVFYRQDKMVKAAKVFRELIEKYPQSDKIDDAAFMCGEIHKEYLPGQEQLAVKWYERAWTWDPRTPHTARFQAAVVYDYRLHDRDRALELYKAVIKDESYDRSNLRFATRRIRELTASGQPSSTGLRASAL